MTTPTLPPLPNDLDKAMQEFARAAAYFEGEGRMAAKSQLVAAIEAYAIAAIQAQDKPQPLSDEQVKKLCNLGPVYAKDGVVSRTPHEYRKELMGAMRAGIQICEAAHGIKGE